MKTIYPGLTREIGAFQEEATLQCNFAPKQAERELLSENSPAEIPGPVIMQKQRLQNLQRYFRRKASLLSPPGPAGSPAGLLLGRNWGFL